MPMKVWLAERHQVLLPQLAVLGVADEQEIARLCEQEIAAWRARPQMKEKNSLRVPMTDTRNAIKELPLTGMNRWLNPRTREWEHIALKYMNFSEEEWAEMNASVVRNFQDRLEDQRLLERPFAILEKAEQLLASARWEEVVVGLAVLTGRRLTEVLKTGGMLPHSQYTLIFSGQLKRRDEILEPYEIPTLVPAEQVLAAWARVRAEVECRALENREVSALYSQQVGDAARRAFHGLVPVRSQDEDIYTHLFRTVYARLAVWLYCPAQVMDLLYMTTIQGLYWVLNAETDEKRHNYMSSLHYNDYKIGDGAGNIDGRQGIRLGEPGVKVLDVFQTPRRGQQDVAHKEKTMNTSLPTQRRSRTGRGLINPRQEIKVQFEQVKRDVEKNTDEALLLLLEEHALYQQIQQLLLSVAPHVGTQLPLATVQALMDAFSQQQSASQAFEAKWGVALGDVDVLFEKVAATGETRPPTTLLTELVGKQQHYRQKHQQRRQETQYDQMPYSQLKGRKDPEAAEERVRRAVAALMRYNEQCEDPVQCWYINASIVQTLLGGGRYPAIQESLQAHKDEIEAHHETLKITSSMNYKGKELVAQRVKIPEEPPVSVSSQEFSLLGNHPLGEREKNTDE